MRIITTGACDEKYITTKQHWNGDHLNGPRLNNGQNFALTLIYILVIQCDLDI